MMQQDIPSSSQVVVIGSGLGGLAAACTLQARGHAVTLIDKNPWLGGKAAQLWGDAPGGGRFRFDMGPTILTVPAVLERLFAEAGETMSDHLELIRLDPQWRCFFDESAGGGVLDLMQRVEEMQAQITRFASGEQAQRYAQFIDYAKQLHRISDQFFFWKSIGGLKDMFDFKTAANAGTLADVMAMRMGRSVASTIRRYVPEPRLAQMLDHFTQYVGSSPYGSPAILCSIAHMQVADGVWYPRGGTRAVPEALLALAQRLGVRVVAGRHVERVLTAAGRVTGVELRGGQRIACEQVVSNMDSVRLHREAVDDARAARRFLDRRHYEPACSGVVLYLGLNKRYDHLAHHDFVFSRDPHEEFDAIYRRGEPAPDPTCYLAATAATEPQTAPPGGEALYVLVHTPFLRPHHDWSRQGPLYRGYRQVILDKLKRTAGLTDLEDRIVFEQALTPQDIHDRYHVLDGAIYGLASHGTFTGAFKPGNRSPDVKGLYLCGGAAHPGPGMPMVMMSGWIAADTLDRDVKGPVAGPVTGQPVAAG